MDKKIYFQERIKQLHHLMNSEGLDVVVVLKPEHVMYYSGFNPIINSKPVFFVLTKEGESFLLVPALRYSHAKEEASVEDVKVYGMWGRIESLGADPLDVLRQLVSGENLRVGLELNYISVEWYKALQHILSPCEIQSISPLIGQQTLIKDEYEIDLIRKAARLADCGTTTIIHHLQVGLNEMEACTEAQYAMRQLWQNEFKDYEPCGYGTADGGMIDSLFAWCLTNERIAYGCDTPKAYRVQSGDISLPMAWAKLDGYHAENERTILVGSVSGTREAAYLAMLKARQNVFNALRPNVPIRDLYHVAAECFSAAGFAHILPGRIGHGIGTSAHEALSINASNEGKIKPGMIISIEPGVMDPSWGGVRHSDTVLITPTGYEVLTKSPAGELRI